jgi:SAM-dependent methyltransferase
LQQWIDGIAYPPTHTYQLDGLIPTGDLRRRLDVFNEIAPGFFDSGNLLDVGCNKGFFSLLHKGEVTGIDTNEEYVRLCLTLRPDGTFIRCAFGEVMFAKPFDKIFIGNGPHYPYAQWGWKYVDLLAELSSGLVLTEGLFEATNRDSRRCIPDKKQPAFTKSKRDEAHERHFIKVAETASPLTHRTVVLWRRKGLLHFADPAHYAGYLVEVYKGCKPLVDTSDVVMEVCVRHDRGVLGRQIIDCRDYIFVDRDEARPGLNLDAVKDELPECDVLISTAILHHTEPKYLSALFANMARATRRRMILVGPSADNGGPLFGDHKYHINVEEMRCISEQNHWKLVQWSRCGLSEPYAEVKLIFEPQ